ncbi:MAG: hypothetical protein E5V52_04645, partial [Mesorhizobium sp.]
MEPQQPAGAPHGTLSRPAHRPHPARGARPCGQPAFLRRPVRGAGHTDRRRGAGLF